MLSQDDSEGHQYQGFVMANLATKPSSHDCGLVARLYISTNMLQKVDAPRVDAGRC